MTLEKHPGMWTYDPEAEAAYIYHESGQVIGIEIVAAWPAKGA